MGKTKADQGKKGKKGGSDDEAYVGTKSKKPAKEKDPNAPKKPTCAYFLFMKERRVSLKKEEPSLQMGPATKKMTAEWQAMSEKDKEKYNKLAEEDKARYHKEMAALGKPVKSAAKKADAGGDGGSNDPVIKKAQSAYFLFQASEREKLKKSKPSLMQKEVMKEIAASWKALNAKQKKVWDDKAVEDKKRYEKELKEAADGKKKGNKKGAKDQETKESDEEEDEGSGEGSGDEEEGEEEQSEEEQPKNQKKQKNKSKEDSGEEEDEDEE